MARTVDRSIARLVATKRIVTGSVSIALAVALALAAATGRAPATAGLALALALLGGGGIWTLRDGLRLRADLKTEA